MTCQVPNELFSLLGGNSSDFRGLYVCCWGSGHDQCWCHPVGSVSLGRRSWFPSGSTEVRSGRSFQGALPLQLVSILKLETIKDQSLVPVLFFFSNQAILRNSWAGGGGVRRLWNPVVVTSFSCGASLGPSIVAGIASFQSRGRKGRVASHKLVFPAFWTLL